MSVGEMAQGDSYDEWYREEVITKVMSFYPKEE